MATTTQNCQIAIVDASGNVNIIYPITAGTNVSISRSSNSNLPTTATTAQKLANALGALAFKNVADIISTDGTTTSTAKTWSSSVINSKLSELSSKVDVIPTSRNSVYRGKDLGTVTASNIDEFISTHGISDGTFEDIYVGDYFTISYAGTKHRILVAGFNIYYNTGDTALSKNHIVCVPDSYFLTATMNSTNTTGVSSNNSSSYGGYAGSDMFNNVIPTVNANLQAIFGSHLLTHRDLISISVDTNIKPKGYAGWSGASNNWAWVDTQATLMSECEVYGGPIWQSSGYDTGISITQLPLFRHQHFSKNRYWFWLKDVGSSTDFCRCYDHGLARCGHASGVSGVRPRFLLG